MIHRAFLLSFAAFLLVAPAGAQVRERLYPAPLAPLDLSGLPAGAMIDTVRTADALSLKGIEIAPRGGKPTFLVLHGNESTAMESIRWLAPLIAEGYGVVAAEYRAYSGNPGTASEAGLAADADAFYDRAHVLAGVGPLIVVGHSLGGGVAFGLATRRRLDAVVTIGAFTRLAAMVPAGVPVPDGERYDNEAAIARFDAPCYLIHGTADDTVPVAQAQELARAAARAHRRGASFITDGGGHAPDGAVLAMILRAIAMKVGGGGKVVSVTLPQTVRLVPFGGPPGS